MNQKNLIKAVGILVVALVLQNCATSSTEKSINEKLANEPVVMDAKKLAEEEAMTISSAKNLTAEQKNKLDELRISAREKANKLEGESLKLRELLLKSLIAENYDRKKDFEVKIIKNKMRKLSRERLNLTLETVEKAQQILGHQARNNEIMMEHFLERDFENRSTY
ncbi:MAG: hypothetical protein WA160_08395 [Pseudobdellovibrio sp.]